MQPQQQLLRPPLPLLLREQKAAHAPDRERPASLIQIVPNGVQRHHSLHAIRRMIAVEVEPSAWLRHVIMQVQRQHLPRLLPLPYPYVPSAAMEPSVVQGLESVSLKALPLVVHVSLHKIRPFFCVCIILKLFAWQDVFWLLFFFWQTIIDNRDVIRYCST